MIAAIAITVLCLDVVKEMAEHKRVHAHLATRDARP